MLVQYIKNKIASLSTFATFSAFVTVVLGMDYVWNNYFTPSKDAEPLIWGLTVATGLFVAFGLLNYCWFSQSNLQSEIDRITDVKARLEAQLLKKRLSSRKKK